MSISRLKRGGSWRSWYSWHSWHYPGGMITSKKQAKKVRKSRKNGTQTFQNRAPGPPKSSPGAFKIEPGTLQEAILKRLLSYEGSRGHARSAFWGENCDLGSKLEAQKLKNRGPKLKKSMLKNNTFLASIFLQFFVIFGKLRTLKIELPPTREHDFWKIGVSQK